MKREEKNEGGGGRVRKQNDDKQAEEIADKFARVSQEYEPLKKDDIEIPKFETKSVPKFSPKDVQKHLEEIKTKKSVPPGDIPPQLIKMFAEQLSVPLC